MEILDELNSQKSTEKGKFFQKFFKTGKGQYGEGDIFLGIDVPTQRKIAKKHVNSNQKELQYLLDSKIHEHRLTALFILVCKYQNKKTSETEKESIAKFYLKNIHNINNWDLVDTSAPHILGSYLYDKDKKILYKLAKSENLWEKRISILATFYFIKKNDFEDALNISQILLNDKHDLIHKAVGWMLREIGKKDIAVLETFLDKHHKIMPRTMLRYAIEKFSKEKKEHYMKK